MKLRLKIKKEKKGNLLYAKFERSMEPPLIIVFLIEKRIVRDEKTAIVLVSSLVVCILILSLLIFVNATSAPVFIDKLN